MGDLDLAGVWPAIVTPFDDDGEVDLQALRRNLQGWGGAPLGGYLALGTTGEFPHLTREEKERVLAATVEAAGDRPVAVQTGEPATRHTIAFTRRAAELGARAALVVAPSYYRGAMRTGELERFYLAVAEHAPLPILLYNIPQNTGVPLPVDLVARLAEHENILGIKDSAGSLAQIAALRAAVPTGWTVFTGADPLLVAALLEGAQGAILAAANVVPYELCDVYQAVRAGDVPRAQEVLRRLGPALRGAAGFGIPGYKAAMDMVGFAGGFPREPLLPLDDARREVLAAALREAQLIRF